MKEKVLLKAEHCEDVKYFSIEDLVADVLDGEDYERGVTETIEATAINNSAAIGRLLEKLWGIGVLGLPDIQRIIGYGEDVTLEILR